MNGWITLKSVHKVSRIPEVTELSHLVLRSDKGVNYKIFWEHSHVTSQINEQGYLEVSFILFRSKEFFPTLTQGGGKFDHMQITSTFLKNSAFVDLLDIVCMVENPDLGEESLKVYGSTLKDTLVSSSSPANSAEIYGLSIVDMYPTIVEISDEGEVYTYLYQGIECLTLTTPKLDKVPVL